MNEAQQLVLHYARATIARERLLEAGQPVPNDLSRNIAFLESLSRDFPPHAQAALAQEVQDARDGILASEMRLTVQQVGQQRQAAAVLVNALRDHHVQKVTKHLSDTGEGLTATQFEQLRKTGQYTKPARLRTDEEMRQGLRDAGINADPDEEMKFYSHLYDNDRARSAYLDKTVGDNGIARAKLEREIADLVIGRGLQQRREANAPAGEFKAYTVDATDSDKRRADVLHAVALTSPEFFHEEYSAATREPGTLRNTIAQAMEQHSEEPLDQISGEEYQRLEQVAGG